MANYRMKLLIPSKLSENAKSSALKSQSSLMDHVTIAKTDFSETGDTKTLLPIGRLLHWVDFLVVVEIVSI